MVDETHSTSGRAGRTRTILAATGGIVTSENGGRRHPGRIAAHVSPRARAPSHPLPVAWAPPRRFADRVSPPYEGVMWGWSRTVKQGETQYQPRHSWAPMSSTAAECPASFQWPEPIDVFVKPCR